MGVPLAVRDHFGGKTAYLESLKTSDLKVARERRDEVERTCRELFKHIKSGKVITPIQEQADRRGELWRETLAALDRDVLHDAVYAAEAEAESYRGKARVKFDKALKGDQPIEKHLEAYLAEANLAPKTKNERRGLVSRLARWCAEEELALPQIDRKTAGRYVTEQVAPMDRRTGKKHMTALREYWRYLIRRAHVMGDAGNPWGDQEMPNKGRRVERGSRDTERPFTEKEMQTLLYADYPTGMDAAHESQIRDAARMSALSGMRLAEVVTLWVEEVHDGVFDIQQGKTAAAARRVPVHPALKEIIARRMLDPKTGESKGPKEWLFHELASERDPGDTFGKRFNRYRKHLMVDDVREGKRRSLVNFHSFRRWFITQARHAGQPVETLEDLVGHSKGKQSITFGVYTSGASQVQMRACVEAVKLPSKQD